MTFPVYGACGIQEAHRVSAVDSERRSSLESPVTGAEALRTGAPFMTFQSEPGVIRWRMHFASPPEEVFDALATDGGRASYWAESAPELEGRITFHILNYEPFCGRLLRRERPRVFALEYFGTLVEFRLETDGRTGTDLSLFASQVDESVRMEMMAGWVSVLMAMKGAVDHGVDLRNHDPSRSWGDGYADN
jgi:uncharacterized protein YndB with AHSA1/START domain